MEYMDYLIWFLVGVILDILIGLLARSWGRSFGWYFFLSFMLSPLVGIIVLLIRGRLTRHEVLNSTPHIFYCPQCKAVFSGLNNDLTFNCLHCGHALHETTVLQKDWKKFSESEKAQMKKSFGQGRFLRYPIFDKETGLSSADEIRKYKELLDSGAITRQEFEQKKDQLLFR